MSAERDGLAARAADVDHLVATDPALAAVVERHGPPPAWSRPPAFATLALQVLEQQLSLDAAAAHFARLLAATDEDELTPTGVLALDDATLRAAGVSRQKARYLRELAGRLEDGRLDLAEVADADDERAAALLTAVPGIGPWTAGVFLLFALQRRDHFPVGDRALQVGTAQVLGLASVPTGSELAAVATRWAPRRSAAAVLVWHDYLARRGRTM